MYKFTHAIILSRGEYDTIIKVDGCLDWDKILYDDYITHALIAEHTDDEYENYITFVNIGQTTDAPIVDQIEGFMNGVKYVTDEYEEHKAIYIYDKEDYVDPHSFPMTCDIINQYNLGKAVWQD